MPALRRWPLAGLVIALALTGPAAAQEQPMVASPCQIQGDGASTPLRGRLVTTQGVVIADFLATDRYGFFVQAPGCDTDDVTSDGIWVYRPKDVDVPEDLGVGDCVRITGTAEEYSGLTEIVLRPGGAAVEGTCEVPPAEHLEVPRDPAAAEAYLEAREAMLVSLPTIRVVGATNGYGDAYVVPADSGVGRILRGAADGRLLGLQAPGWWRPFGHGDTAIGVSGGLTYNYGVYKVMLPKDTPLRVTESGLQPPHADPTGAETLTVATFNVENLFDPIDDPDRADEDDTPSPELYARQVGVRACTIARSLGAPDVVGLQEIENERVLADLAAQAGVVAQASTDDRVRGADYAGALVEGIDTRGIDVAFLYRRDRVRLLDLAQRQACNGDGVDGSLPACTMPDGTPGRLLYSRPPLVARFEVVATGGRINAIVNHFRSKLGGDAASAPIRLAMARHNLALVHDLQRLEPTVPVVVVGDLNDDEESPTLAALEEGGRLESTWRRVSAETRYSYIYNGVSQVLDHILVPPDLRSAEFQPVHVNVDFAAVPDSGLRGTCAPGEAHEVSSDHDPLLLRVPVGVLPQPSATAGRVFLPIALRRGVVFENATATVTTAIVPTTTPTIMPTSTATPQPPTTPRPTASVASSATASATRATTPAPTLEGTATNTPGPIPTPTHTPDPRPTGSVPFPPRSPLRIDALFPDGQGSAEPDEYVEFTNVTAGPVDLTGWQVVSVQGDQHYAFPYGARMNAGQSCRVYTNETHTEWCGFDWASGQAIWRNSGDKAEIRNAAGTLVDWFCFGNWVDQCRP